jgi:hypothetical protein
MKSSIILKDNFVIFKTKVSFALPIENASMAELVDLPADAQASLRQAGAL